MDMIAILPLLFRGAERISIVAVAALCIILGYKLFKIVPDRHEGEGSLSLGDLSVSLSKIGPGVFFSLFGAVVLYQALQSVLKVDPVVYQPDVQVDSPLHNLSWMGPQIENTLLWADRAIGPIKILNCLERNVSGSEVRRDRIKSAIHTAKVAIIADVWQEEWGNSEDFTSFNMGNVPAGSNLGELYHAIDENCQID